MVRFVFVTKHDPSFFLMHSPLKRIFSELEFKWNESDLPMVVCQIVMHVFYQEIGTSNRNLLLKS